MAFALVHYERALRDFDLLKAANRTANKEAALATGVYCIVSVAACLEAVANKLFFIEKGRHPTMRDRGTPLEKLDAAAATLVAQTGGTYVPLHPNDASYVAMERVRVLRNSFMHASERDAAISPDTLLSKVFDEVSEARCRAYLRELRLTVGKVFDQLPKLPAPIVTRANTTWLGSLEVP